MATTQNLDCAFCRRTFYKLEHLKRHERSHTGSRPYACDVCTRAFGRQDSLYRHMRLHSKDHAGSKSYSSPAPSRAGTEIAPSHGGEASVNDNLDPQLTDDSRTAPSLAPTVPMDRQIVPARQEGLNPADQSGYDLMWPDSEQLFRTIVSSGSDAGQQSGGVFLSYASPVSPQAGAARFGDQPPSIDLSPGGESGQVVSGVRNMVHSQSSNVTSAVNVNAIDSVFLDECLHMFFLRFIPTFPILHRPTFEFRDCLQPLLLNAIAIGSLYLGHANAIAQGEVLWRLAHTALATMWQDMISHRGSYDERPGIQLLVTSLLGQIYGILSRNQTIRMTSQAFHVLAFSWAKQCGISGHDAPPVDPPAPLDESEQSKDRYWKRWVASSIQQRAMLAHFAIDGLISRTMGTSTSARHLSNRLPLRCDDGAFAAQNADDFLLAVRTARTYSSTLSFRSILSQLLSRSDTIALPPHAASSFNIMVLLEGLQSFLSDTEDERIGPNYAERAPLLSHALVHIHQAVTNDPDSIPMNDHERLEALLRWHALCLEAIINTSKLCRVICRAHDIQYDLWMQDNGLTLEIDLINWPRTPDGRRALLHAVAIQGVVEDLPRGRAHAIHMPSSLFASATICATFSLAGANIVNLPSTVSWEEVLTPSEQYRGVSEPSETYRFIHGEPDSTTVTFGAYRNLAYEFNSMQKLFGCLATQWGVAAQMGEVVRQWAALFH